MDTAGAHIFTMLYSHYKTLWGTVVYIRPAELLLGCPGQSDLHMACIMSLALSDLHHDSIALSGITHHAPNATRVHAFNYVWFASCF